MDILPLRPSELFKTIQVPYLEGCARLNLCWQGVDFSLALNPLSWEDRAVCLLQGTVLMIPLVNTIVWLAWKTFGNPIQWADPFCKDSSILPRVVPPLSPAARHYVNSEGEFSTWKVTSSEHFDVVTEQAARLSSSARYHEGQLQEWVCRHGGQLMHICNTSNGLQIQADPPIHLRYSEAPWIQQPNIGLKSWILSDQKTLDFDTVLYEHLPWAPFEALPLLLTMRATKHETLETPEGRRLLKVEIAPLGKWLLEITCKSEWWFDVETAAVYQFNNAGLFMHPESGRVFQNRRLP